MHESGEYSPKMRYRFAGIEEDMGRLDRLLGEMKRMIGWREKSDAVRVMNLACGRADETGVLWRNFMNRSADGWYYGCDLRAAEIAEARKRWPSPAGCAWHVEFREADASLAHALPRGGADVVFIRHQNFWDAPAVWDRIYRNALACLADDGKLVITSYFDREHELALAALRLLGAGLIVDIPHLAGRQLPDAPGKYVDRRLAVLSRSSDSFA